METMVRSIIVLSNSIYIIFFSQNMNTYYDFVQSILTLLIIIFGYRLGTYVGTIREAIEDCQPSSPVVRGRRRGWCPIAHVTD